MMYGLIDEVQELRAENACLQKRVVERHGSDCIASWEEARTERDEARALAKRRKEALELAIHKAEQIRDGQSNPKQRARAIIQVARAAIEEVSSSV
jgi:hypothetical protein